MTSRFYYWDKETQTFKEGYPPDPNPKFGQAPIVTMGTITPMRHPGTGQIIDNVRDWDLADKMSGTYTTTKREAVRRPDRSAEIRRDMDEAFEKAIADVDNGNAPLTEEMKAKCKEQNEFLSKQLGIDAQNAFGRGSKWSSTKSKKTKKNKPQSSPKRS